MYSCEHFSWNKIPLHQFSNFNTWNFLFQNSQLIDHPYKRIFARQWRASIFRISETANFNDSRSCVEKSTFRALIYNCHAKGRCFVCCLFFGGWWLNWLLSVQRGNAFFKKSFLKIKKRGRGNWAWHCIGHHIEICQASIFPVKITDFRFILKIQGDPFESATFAAAHVQSLWGFRSDTNNFY